MSHTQVAATRVHANQCWRFCYWITGIKPTTWNSFYTNCQHWHTFWARRWEWVVVWSHTYCMERAYPVCVSVRGCTPMTCHAKFTHFDECARRMGGCNAKSMCAYRNALAHHLHHPPPISLSKRRWRRCELNWMPRTSIAHYFTFPAGGSRFRAVRCGSI